MSKEINQLSVSSEPSKVGDSNIMVAIISTREELKRFIIANAKSVIGGCQLYKTDIMGVNVPITLVLYDVDILKNGLKGVSPISLEEYLEDSENMEDPRIAENEIDRFELKKSIEKNLDIELLRYACGGDKFKFDFLERKYLTKVLAIPMNIRWAIFILSSIHKYINDRTNVNILSWDILLSENRLEGKKSILGEAITMKSLLQYLESA